MNLQPVLGKTCKLGEAPPVRFDCALHVGDLLSCRTCAVPRLRSDRARGPHRTGLSCAGRGPGQPARTLARGQAAPRPYRRRCGQ